MAKAVVTLYGDDASVYGSLVLTQVWLASASATSFALRFRLSCLSKCS